MQAAQDITIGARLNKTQFQYTLNDADAGELTHWATLFLDRIKASPASPTSPPISSMPGRCSTSRSSAKSPQVTASCPTRSTTRSTTLSASASSRPCIPPCSNTMSILEVDPKFQYGPEALNGIYVKSSSGQQVPLSTLVDTVVKVAPLVDQPSGPVPLGDDLVQSGARRRDRPGGKRYSGGRKAATPAALAADQLPGKCPGIRRVAEEHADSHHRIAVRHLSHPRRAVREPDPPDHHHLDPAVGRPRRAAVADGGLISI